MSDSSEPHEFPDRSTGPNDRSPIEERHESSGIYFTAKESAPSGSASTGSSDLSENVKPSVGPSPLVRPDDDTVVRRRQPFGGTSTKGVREPKEVKRLVGKSFRYYTLDRLIGYGGMGVVFRATDVRLNRTVAIKILTYRDGRNEEIIRRFQQEAQSAAQLAHENIAQVYDVGEADGWNFIAFEFVDGPNIRDMVIADGPLTVGAAIGFVIQTAEALAHASSRDIVHRDVKPSNLIVTPDFQVKLVDMGLARLRDVESDELDLTESGMTLGTFDYISPEQARDPRDADIRSDLYSLGCSFFFMLTGRPPFPPGTAAQKLLQHANEPPPDPRQFRHDVPDSLADVLFRLLEKSPASRFQTPSELITALRHVAEEERIELPRMSIAKPTPLPDATPSLLTRQLPWLVPIGILLASVFAVGGFPWSTDASVTPWEDSSVAFQSLADQPIPSDAHDRTPLPAPAPSSSSPPRSQRPIVTTVDSIGGVGRNNIAHVPIGRDLPSKINEVRRVIVADPGSLAPRHDTLVSRTLDEALTYSDLPNLREIEIRTPVVQITQPLRLEGKRLSVVAGEDFSPVVRVRIDAIDQADRPRNGALDILPSESDSVSQGEPLFDIRGGEFRLKGIVLQIESDDRTLFGLDSVCRISNAARMEMDDCWIRSEVIAENDQPLALFDVGAPVHADDGMEQPTIVLRDCIVHGEVHLVRARFATPFDVEWSNGFFASSAQLMRIGGAMAPMAVDQSVFVQLDHVTAAIERGLVLFEASVEAPELIRIDVESTNCIYVGSRSHPLIEQIAYNVPVDQFEDYFTFRGRRNFYEEINLFWRQTVRDQANAEPQTRTVNFAHWREYWRNETSSRWNDVQWQSRITGAPAHLLVPEDFALSPLPGNPAGLTLSAERSNAGMRTDDLPRLPVLSVAP